MNQLAIINNEGFNRFSNLEPSHLSENEKSTLITLAIDVLAGRYKPGQLLNNPEDVKTYLRLRFSDLQNEVFGAVFLDTRHRIIQEKVIFTGTVDSTSIHSRVVVQHALALNASALICYHNHPSGEVDPSEADKRITRLLKEALSLIDVRLLDHFVVGKAGTYSLAEDGLM